MSENEKEAIIYLGLGLIWIIIGIYLWCKFPNNKSYIFCFYYGGLFIGIWRERC